MKCLTLHQPWASLMAAGLKRVETRSWPLHYRGPLLIHAGKKWDADLAFLAAGRPFRTALEQIGVVFEATEEAAQRGWGIPFGAIIGRVDVTGCVGTDRVGRWEQTRGEVDRNYLFDNVGIMGPCDGKPYLFVSDAEKAFGDYSPDRFAFVCSDPIQFEAPIPFKGCIGLFNVPDHLIPEDYRS